MRRALEDEIRGISDEMKTISDEEVARLIRANSYQSLGMDRRDEEVARLIREDRIG